MRIVFNKDARKLLTYNRSIALNEIRILKINSEQILEMIDYTLNNVSCMILGSEQRKFSRQSHGFFTRKK